MNMDILKDAKSELTSNMLPNMHEFLIFMTMLSFELALP